MNRRAFLLGRELADMVKEIDDIGRSINRLKRAGVNVVHEITTIAKMCPS